jgi:hypothetical protein
MAIEISDMTALTDMLKEVYGTGLQQQFNDEMISFNTLEKADAKYDLRGKGFTFGARVSRAQGSIGGRKESEMLPAPTPGKQDNGKITPTYQYGRLRITGPMLEAAKGDAAAFVDGLDDGISDVYEALKWDCERQFHGDGFGLLATVAAASTATPATSTWTVTVTSTKGVQYLRPGMIVDFFQSTAIDADTVAQRVLSLDAANNQIKFEGFSQDYVAYHPIAAVRSYTNDTDTVAAASLIVTMGARETTHATTNTAREMTGIEGQYDDGTLLASFENITVSGNEWWKANILSNSGTARELTEDLMIQAYDLGRIQGGAKPNRIRMGLGQQRKYFALHSPDVRFQPQVVKGGFKTLQFAAGDGDCDILIDPLTQPGKMYFEPRGIIKKYIQRELDWMKMDQMMHWVSGYDQWDMALAMYGNIGCEQRNCLTKITDLKEPGKYS